MAELFGGSVLTGKLHRNSYRCSRSLSCHRCRLSCSFDEFSIEIGRWVGSCKGEIVMVAAKPGVHFQKEGLAGLVMNLYIEHAKAMPVQSVHQRGALCFNVRVCHSNKCPGVSFEA